MHAYKQPAIAAGSGRSTWRYAEHFRHQPMRIWAHLLVHPHRLRYAVLAVFGVGVGYGLVEAGIAVAGGTPSPPWLAIPAADYFKWEALFSAPVTLLCWILAAGVMHLLARPFGGHGTFDDTLALLGFAVAVATLIALIPDSVTVGLMVVGVMSRPAWEQAISQAGTPDWLLLWAYMLAYVIALLCLFPTVVAASEGLRRWRAVLVGVIGAVLYQGIYFIFIR
jgi:hypothetical protein